MPPNHPVRIGFSSTDLWGCWQTDAILDDEIRVQACAIAAPEKKPYLIVDSDLCLMWPAIALELRRAVSQATGIAEPGIAIFCTQNHGVPFISGNTSPFGDLAALKSRFCQASQQALANLMPAHSAYVETTLADHELICRRKSIDSIGTFTYWYGYESTDRNQVVADSLVDQTLAGLLNGDLITSKSPVESTALPTNSPVTKPVIMDEQADRLVQGLFFRTPDGEPIGALIRAAAHPATSTGLRSTSTGGDYPVYARRRITQAFGGQALFLTGPCGNQAFPVNKKSTQYADLIGKTLADRLLSVLNSATWEPVSNVVAETATITLPLRQDIPSDRDASRVALQAATDKLEQLQSQSAPLSDLKKAADLIETLTYYAGNHIYDWTGLDFADFRKGQCSHQLFALRIDDTILVGLPGEPFGTYSTRLRQKFPEMNVIAGEECNGYLAYIPTADEFPKGGYEACATPFDQRVEQSLLGQLTSLIHQVSD